MRPAASLWLSQRPRCRARWIQTQPARWATWFKCTNPLRTAPRKASGGRRCRNLWSWRRNGRKDVMGVKASIAQAERLAAELRGATDGAPNPLAQYTNEELRALLQIISTLQTGQED